MNFFSRFKRAVQAFQYVDILTGLILPGVSPGDRGTQYISYQSQVGEAWRRYRVQAQFGNLQVRAVLNFWISWICGNGVNFKAKTSAEKTYLKTFLKHNRLDSVLIQDMVLNGMAEGQNLSVYKPGEECTLVRPLSFEQYKYKVFRKKDDREVVEAIEITDSNGSLKKLSPEDFAYMTLSANDPKTGMPVPPIGPVLTPAINMDIAMADWRDMNHIWGSMGLVFETKDWADAEKLRATLVANNETEIGWQFGDTLVGPVKPHFPEPSGRGQESILNEITNNARFISGYSGVGIHLLGWSSEMSNRATAVELGEARTAFVSRYREMYQDYASKIVNDCFMRDMGSEGTIEATLPEVSNAMLKELIDVWLPLNEAGKITDRTLLSRIPGIEPDKELQEIEKQSEKEGEEEQEEEIPATDKLRMMESMK